MAPNTHQAAESTIFPWSATHADTVYITTDIRAVNATGSITVQRARITRYAITATGPGGQASAMARVYVQGGAVYEYGTPPRPSRPIWKPSTAPGQIPLAEASRLGIDLFEGAASAPSAAIRPRH